MTRRTPSTPARTSTSDRLRPTASGRLPTASGPNPAEPVHPGPAVPSRPAPPAPAHPHVGSLHARRPVCPGVTRGGRWVRSGGAGDGWREDGAGDGDGGRVGTAARRPGSVPSLPRASPRTTAPTAAGGAVTPRTPGTAQRAGCDGHSGTPGLDLGKHRANYAGGHDTLPSHQRLHSSTILLNSGQSALAIALGVGEPKPVPSAPMVLESPGEGGSHRPVSPTRGVDGGEDHGTGWDSAAVFG